MKYLSTSLLLLLFGMAPLAAEDVKVIYDDRPDEDIPREARFADTALDASRNTNSHTGVEFRVATDLKDYGPLRNIITNQIDSITVRYFEKTFATIPDIQKCLNSVLRSEKGNTTSHRPWAQSLPVPSVESSIRFTNGDTGKWFFWRQGFSVYRDPVGKWWFTYWMKPDW
jgi:hypothetical protein